MIPSERDPQGGGRGREAREREDTPRARLTPYELVFTEGEFETTVFPRIAEEAAATGLELLEPEQFQFLSIAADAVREVAPEDAAPEAFDQYRALVFHAFHFWRGGRRLFVVDPAAARFLVEAGRSLDEWTFGPAGLAGYLQLPANLFWSTIAPDTPPEPVDGFFLTVAQHEASPGERILQLQMLLVLGIRRARSGFSVIPIRTAIGRGIESPWDAPPRPDGDFANILPGGEMSGLYSILTTGEALKLAARAFTYIARNPDQIVPVRAEDPREDATAPPPTRLAYDRITLGGAGGGGEPA